MTPLCGNEWDLILSLRFVVETLLVNDMPLSSSPTLGSPPILPAKRDNEGADGPKLHTKRGEISTTHELSLYSEKLFLFAVSFLLRLFPDSLQMLVQTCSNSPTDQEGYIGTCLTQTMEGSLETSSM